MARCLVDISFEHNPNQINVRLDTATYIVNMVDDAEVSFIITSRCLLFVYASINQGELCSLLTADTHDTIKSFQLASFAHVTASIFTA